MAVEQEQLGGTLGHSATLMGATDSQEAPLSPLVRRLS
jgi:hypothetical protein